MADEKEKTNIINLNKLINNSSTFAYNMKLKKWKDDAYVFMKLFYASCLAAFAAFFFLSLMTLPYNSYCQNIKSDSFNENNCYDSTALNEFFSLMLSNFIRLIQYGIIVLLFWCWIFSMLHLSSQQFIVLVDAEQVQGYFILSIEPNYLDESTYQHSFMRNISLCGKTNTVVIIKVEKNELERNKELGLFWTTLNGRKYLDGVDITKLNEERKVYY